MYADTMTRSMKETIDETNRRREIQLKYNEENGITPKGVIRAHNEILSHKNAGTIPTKAYVEKDSPLIAAEPVLMKMDKLQLQQLIETKKKELNKVVKDLDFIEAARIRDEVIELEDLLNQKKDNIENDVTYPKKERKIKK